MIRIDGSTGEGGGQMLRTALSLALVTGQPFEMENIRAGREKPGLLRQHLTAVLAAAEIGNAKVQGAALGSKTLRFYANEIRPGNYRFAVGTAGSGTLVLQTVLPALMTASGPSTLVLEGGTHNTHAPPFDFLNKTFLPTLARFGPRVSVRLDRFGFYPAGGGRITVEIQPCSHLSPVVLESRGDVTTRKAIAIVANLSRNIAERELAAATQALGWEASSAQIMETNNSPGPGNILFLELGSAQVTEVISAFGRLGATSEQVAQEAVEEARTYLKSDAVAGEHLADQLLLPLALAGSGSFTATKLTLHARTNMEVISLFLPSVAFQAEREENFTRITVKGNSRA